MLLLMVVPLRLELVVMVVVLQVVLELVLLLMFLAAGEHKQLVEREKFVVLIKQVFLVKAETQM